MIRTDHLLSRDFGSRIFHARGNYFQWVRSPEAGKLCATGSRGWRTSCRGETDLDEGEVVFVGGRAARLSQEGQRGIGAGCSGAGAVHEMLGEFLEGQHGTIGPDDFIGAVAENKEAIEVVQGDLAIGIGAVRERADGRAWSLERLDVGAGPVRAGD